MANQATEMTGTPRGFVKSERHQRIAALAFEYWLESFPGWVTGNGLASGRPGSPAQDGGSADKANHGWTVSVAAESSIRQG